MRPWPLYLGSRKQPEHCTFMLAVCVCVWVCAVCVSADVQISAEAQIHAQISAQINAKMLRSEHRCWDQCVWVCLCVCGCVCVSVFLCVCVCCVCCVDGDSAKGLRSSLSLLKNVQSGVRKSIPEICFWHVPRRQFFLNNIFAKKWVPKWNPLLGLSIEKKRGGGGRGGPNLTLSFAGEAASFLDLRKVIKILKLCYWNSIV